MPQYEIHIEAPYSDGRQDCVITAHDMDAAINAALALKASFHWQNRRAVRLFSVKECK